MSKFDYNAYMQKQQQKQTSASTTDKKYVKVEYLNSYLKKDGDYIIVRFPYSTTEDFDLVHVHNFVFPGKAYAQHVECSRNDGDPVDNCPLCKEKVPMVNRFLVKVLAYVHETDNEGKTSIKIIPAVWDRPFSYATELANKINEYGDLKEHLFKLKRNGTGTSTTYSTDIVLNKAVYSPEVYKADFELLTTVNPSKLLVRSIDKWIAIKKPATKEEEQTPIQPQSEPVQEKLIQNQPVQQPSQQQSTKRTYSFN